MKNKIEITSGAIHDIRNSLNAIIGFSQIVERMIKEGNDINKIILYINNIKESGEKINSIIINELKSVESKDIPIKLDDIIENTTPKQIDENTYKEIKLLLNNLSKHPIYETEKLIDVVLELEVLLSKNEINTSLVNEIKRLKIYILDADKKNVNLLVKEILKIVYL